MNRTEFVVVTVIVLTLSFALGWFVNWLVHRFTRVTQADLGELEKMAQALTQFTPRHDHDVVHIVDENKHPDDAVGFALVRISIENLQLSRAICGLIW